MLEQTNKRTLQQMSDEVKSMGLIASKIYIKKYIEDNFYGKEQKLLLLALKFSHMPSKLVRAIHEFEPYKEIVEQKQIDDWLINTRNDFSEFSGVSKHIINESGNINPHIVNAFLRERNVTLTKNSFFFLFKQFNKILLEGKKTVIGHTFFEQKGDILDHERIIVYRRILELTNNGSKHIIVNDTKLYENSTKKSSEFKYMVNGLMSGSHYFARFDSAGFASKAIVKKHLPEIKVPQDIEAVLNSYLHTNNVSLKKRFGGKYHIKSTDHMHELDTDFEFAKAILEYYSQKVSIDFYAQKPRKNFKTKMNARNVTFYTRKDSSKDVKNDYKKQHMKDLKSLKGKVPFAEVLEKINDELNIETPEQFKLNNLTYELIDTCPNNNIEPEELNTVNSINIGVNFLTQEYNNLYQKQ